MSEELILDKITEQDFSEVYEQQEMMSMLNEMVSDFKKVNDMLELNESPTFRSLYTLDYNAVLQENIDKSKRALSDDDSDDFEAPVISTSFRDGQKTDPVERENALFENLLEAEI